MSSYSYLGIGSSSNGTWDIHIKKLFDNGGKVNQLHKVISKKNTNFKACRLLLSHVCMCSKGVSSRGDVCLSGDKNIANTNNQLKYICGYSGTSLNGHSVRRSACL